MSPIFQTICKKVSERKVHGYGAAVLIGLLLWAPSLLSSGLTQIWDPNTLLLLLTISGAISKFLSGFGIMLTYAAFCAVVFKITAPSLKGKKSRLKAVKTFLMAPIIAIVIYAAYVIWKTVMLSGALSSLEVITAIYGAWSLLLAIYIVPAIRGEYQPEFHKGSLDEARETVSEVKHKVWRGYQFYIHRDYGKVYASEYERYRERLNSLRLILGAIMLLPLSIVLAIVPPVAGITVVLWIRLLSTDYQPLSRAERLLLVFLVLTLLGFITYLFLSPGVAMSLFYLNLSYATGIFVSIIVLAYVILRS